MNFIGNSYDSMLQDTTSHVLPNINQYYHEDEYGDLTLSDWRGTRIDPEDRVFIVRFFKNVEAKYSPRRKEEDFLIKLATDESLIDLFDRFGSDLYWSTDITIGEELTEE